MYGLAKVDTNSVSYAATADVEQKYKHTRSTGTVHTSAKARLTSVAIKVRIHQNLIICLLANLH